MLGENFMIDGIAQKVGMHFTQELSDGNLLIHGFVDGKLIGSYRINMSDSDIVKGKINVFERGKGYARPIIERAIEVLREIKLPHYVYLSNPEAEKKLTRIFRDNGYTETEDSHLVFNYG